MSDAARDPGLARARSCIDAPQPPRSWLLVNGVAQPWQPGLTVADVLQARGTSGDQVATAVNGAFVPRQSRADLRLAAGDAVLVFGAIVGG